MRLSVAIIVTAFVAVGCGRPSGPIELTYFGTEEGMKTALAAGEEWNRVCGRALVTFVGRGGIPAVEVAPDADLGGKVGDASYEFGEATRIRVKAILPLNVAWNGVEAERGWQRSVWAHEMGHAMGLEHRVDGIMMNGTTADSHITAEDCASLP